MNRMSLVAVLVSVFASPAFARDVIMANTEDMKEFDRLLEKEEAAKPPAAPPKAGAPAPPPAGAPAPAGKRPESVRERFNQRGAPPPPAQAPRNGPGGPFGPGSQGGPGEPGGPPGSENRPPDFGGGPPPPRPPGPGPNQQPPPPPPAP